LVRIPEHHELIIVHFNLGCYEAEIKNVLKKPFCDRMFYLEKALSGSDIIMPKLQTGSDHMFKEPIFLEPQYRDYVWGGSRLRPGVTPTAEMWAIYAEDKIITGSLAGRSLAEAARETGAALLGKKVVAHTGTRFPLLIKLLDCAQWLSLQVHPDDRTARELEGEGQFGKMEGWYFLEAEPGAEILCGLKPGTLPEQMQQAMHSRKLLNEMQRLTVKSGDAILIEPGMIHALGPGLLAYEVQQTSDWTYRVWDWDRPETPQRPLHIQKSLQAARPDLTGKLVPPPDDTFIGQYSLLNCPYFHLSMLMGVSAGFDMDTEGDSFHALTAVSGEAELAGDGWRAKLEERQSLLIPAQLRRYRLATCNGGRVLMAKAH